MFFGTMSHERTQILHNVQAIAKASKLFKVPTILTTVAAKSFSGDMVPEVQSVFPEYQPIDRTSMNSWEDKNFRRAIEATGKKKIVIAGLWTEVCVSFPTIQMIAEGYEIYVPTDACGDVSTEAHERAVQRIIQAGAVPMTSFQYMFELQRDWAKAAWISSRRTARMASACAMQSRFSVNTRAKRAKRSRLSHTHFPETTCSGNRSSRG
jgi:nicotinamidase-related amidase